MYEACSKTTANAAAECDPTERKGSSIGEAARRTLVTVCGKFHLCALCGVGCLQPTPHSAHSLPAESPTSQQSQQDR